MNIKRPDKKLKHKHREMNINNKNMNERKGRELQTQEIKVVQHNPAYRDS